jgi:nitroimidazol reductase NimA-like FMN-containing flavoprotein (pyridoxamine 5'-phosphate oxidase superfamily)
MSMPDGVQSSKDTAPSQDPVQEKRSTAERVGRLLAGQPYAVLCTQGQSQPYASLVAFAASEDLKTLVFSTPVATRKYRLLTECESVALLIDSRSALSADIMQVEAVTVTGRARLVAAATEFDGYAGLLTTRHPHLAAFVRADSSALFCVEVARYFHVCRFQEVRQWAPGSDS